MKKILALLVCFLAVTPTFAQHHHHRHWGYHTGHNNWHWVGPTIIGGVIGYEIARNQQVVVVQPPVTVQNTPVVVRQICGPWTEVQNADGTITRSRTCTQ